MIIRGGENISPVEIESCLSLHPAVLEVAVVGLADERWGKIVTAFVKRRGPVSEQDLEQFCRISGLARPETGRDAVSLSMHCRKSSVGKATAPPAGRRRLPTRKRAALKRGLTP